MAVEGRGARKHARGPGLSGRRGQGRGRAESLWQAPVAPRALKLTPVGKPKIPVAAREKRAGNERVC